MPYLSTMDVSRMSSGLMAAGIPLLGIIGRFGFGWLGDIFEKKYVMAISYSLMALGMAEGLLDPQLPDGVLI